MKNFFKRRRPEPAHRAIRVQIEPADQIIAAYHRLSPEQWAKLPAMVKADLRESVVWELRQAS